MASRVLLLYVEPNRHCGVAKQHIQYGVIKGFRLLRRKRKKERKKPLAPRVLKRRENIDTRSPLSSSSAGSVPPDRV